MCPRPLSSGACVAIAMAAAGCFVDAAGGGMVAGEGGAQPSSSTTGDTATSQGGGSPSSTSGLGGAGGFGGTGGTGPVLEQECTGDEVAIDIEDGTLVCAPLDVAVRAAIDDGCDVQLGYSEACDVNCSNPAQKWGATSLDTCSQVGSGNTCGDEDLGGQTVRLLGVNTQGNVDTDDRFYAGFTCELGDEATVNCGDPDALMKGTDAGEAVCSRATGAMYAALRSCAFVLGWGDDCGNGCTNPPLKIGSASASVCDDGDALGSTCTVSPFDPTSQLVGFDFNGDVNEDDRFYFGLSCVPGTPATSTAFGSCPPGQFVTGIYQDGSLRCRTIAELSRSYFQQHCWLYAGQRDQCGSCGDPPTRWGQVRDGGCDVGIGANNTCTSVMFAGQNVSLVSFNPAGDVNFDDKFYVGLSCQP